jgi:hypothetical protein
MGIKGCQMKIVDCFPFFDEFMILDIRFRELYDVVDMFVIMEAEETFTGIPKPLALSDSLYERYPQYADKVYMLKVGKIDTSNTDNPIWAREYYQKNHISKQTLSSLNLDDEDLILFSDVDEIPKRAVVQSMRDNGFDPKGGGFGGPTYYYKLNILTTEWSHRPRWISYKYFENHTIQRYDDSFMKIPGSGWHFSSLKSAEDIKIKIEAFSHSEFTDGRINTVDHIQASIDNVQDMFERPGMDLIVVPMDDSYPEYVKENLEKMKEWIA